MRLSAIAVGLALICAPGPGLTAPPRGFEEAPGHVLRHVGTGLTLPAMIADLKAQGLDGSAPAVAIYAAPGEPDPLKHFLTIAIESTRSPPSAAETRDRIRAAVSEGKIVQALAEAPFDWPGHPRARTFRGRYALGEVNREVWTASDGGFGVLVMITAPKSDVAELDRLSAAVARDVFGGASVGALPSPG